MLEGKVALVTGGGSGIGAATVEVLVREGARVLVADLDGAAAGRVAGRAGDAARATRADVTRAADTEAMVAAVLAAFGRLDCAVNCAGISGEATPLQDVDPAAWERTLAVNLTGVFLSLKYEIPALHAAGGGAIVNVSSGAGVVAAPGLGAYCASKHGVLGLTKTAALENARRGVRVNAICPGSVDTPMLRGFFERTPGAEEMIRRSQPGGRLGAPGEIAEAAAWLCSDRASFVNGESLLVDGGAVAR